MDDCPCLHDCALLPASAPNRQSAPMYARHLDYPDAECRRVRPDPCCSRYGLAASRRSPTFPRTQCRPNISLRTSCRRRCLSLSSDARPCCRNRRCHETSTSRHRHRCRRSASADLRTIGCCDDETDVDCRRRRRRRRFRRVSAATVPGVRPVGRLVCRIRIPDHWSACRASV